jgi:hypothetical protein
MERYKIEMFHIIFILNPHNAFADQSFDQIHLTSTPHDDLPIEVRRTDCASGIVVREHHQFTCHLVNIGVFSTSCP